MMNADLMRTLDNWRSRVEEGYNVTCGNDCNTEISWY